jgi:hypothetical protein
MLGFVFTIMLLLIETLFANTGEYEEGREKEVIILSLNHEAQEMTQKQEKLSFSFK